MWHAHLFPSAGFTVPAELVDSACLLPGQCSNILRNNHEKSFDGISHLQRLYCIPFPAVPCVFSTGYFALCPVPSSPLLAGSACDSNRPSSKARFDRVATGLWGTGRKGSETSLLSCSVYNDKIIFIPTHGIMKNCKIIYLYLYLFIYIIYLI